MKGYDDLDYYRIGVIKKGTLLKCISDETWPGITKGHLYVATRTTDVYPNWIYIVMDDGVSVNDFPVRVFDIIIEP